MARLIVEYGLLEAERVCQKRTKGFLIDVDIFVARQSTQARDTIKTSTAGGRDVERSESRVCQYLPNYSPATRSKRGRTGLK
jgi:hypothetical protein